MLHLDCLFVCFEEERGNSLIRASNTAIICHKWEGAGLLVGKGAAQGGGEARGAADRREKQDGCHWAPRGHYTSSSALSKHHDLLWVLNRVVLFSSS